MIGFESFVLAAATDSLADEPAAREHDTAVIVSTHDFGATPDSDRLRELLAEASERGDVAKLAVTAEGTGDVLGLLAAT